MQEVTTGNVHRFGKVAKRVAPRAKLVEGADTGVGTGVGTGVDVSVGVDVGVDGPAIRIIPPCGAHQ